MIHFMELYLKNSRRNCWQWRDFRRGMMLFFVYFMGFLPTYESIILTFNEFIEITSQNMTMHVNHPVVVYALIL